MMANTTLNKEHAQTVHEIADGLHEQLDTFATAVAAGGVDEQMTFDLFYAMAEMHPTIEETAPTAHAIDDDESDRFRAMDEARRIVHHLATEQKSSAVMAAPSAAEYAERA